MGKKELMKIYRFEPATLQADKPWAGIGKKW